MHNYREYRENNHDHNQNGPHLSDNDRTMGLLAWLLQFVSTFIAPLIILLINDKKSLFVDHHAKQSLNFAISLTIYSIISGLLIFVVVGIFTTIALGIFSLVVIIQGAMAANRGEYYTPPLTIQFLK